MSFPTEQFLGGVAAAAAVAIAARRAVRFRGPARWQRRLLGSVTVRVGRGWHGRSPLL
ncbi:MAG: hypothetical protein UZ07_CHB004000302, partial [Chlorobi bacterium OLB7]